MWSVSFPAPAPPVAIGAWLHENTMLIAGHSLWAVAMLWIGWIGRAYF